MELSKEEREMIGAALMLQANHLEDQAVAIATQNQQAADDLRQMVALNVLLAKRFAVEELPD